MIKSLSLLTAFLVLFSQIQVPVKAVETETIGFEVGLEIDDASGSIAADFDHIDRFNEYGIAIIVKDTFNDKNELIKKYGLINKAGEVVLDPIYTSIIDYDDNYFSVMNYGENIFEEGIASKRDGSLAVPIKYNYIPNMDGNGVYTVGYNSVIENKTIWISDLYSYFDGVIRLAEMPEGFIKDNYENLWSRRIYPDVYQASAYREIVTEERTEYENVNWLSNSKGEVIFYEPNAYIQNFHKLNGTYYFVANTYNGDMETSSGGLYKLEYKNDEPIVTTLLNPDDYNSIWMDSSKNEVEAYRVTNNQWMKGVFHLETGWVGADAFGVNQKETFSYWGNPKFNITMECTIKEDNKRDCLHYLSLATDPTNANLFGDKKYTYVMTSQFSEFILVSDDITKKSNIFVNKDGQYFFAFEEDVDGWIWVDQNYFVRRGDSTIDLKNIDRPITQGDARVVNYGNNTMAQELGADIFQFCNYQEQKCELIDRKTHESILGIVNYIDGFQLSNGYMTGNYSVLNDENQSVFKSYIYDTTSRNLVFNDYGSAITSVNDKGYAILSSSSGERSLLYKDGTVLVAETDLNHNFETYFDKDIIIGLSIAKNLYLLDGVTVHSYLGLDSAIVSESAPTFIQKNNIQSYVYDNSIIDTSIFTKLGAFVDGYSYVQNASGVYRIDFESSLDNKSLIEDVVNFVGAIVQSGTGFEYRDISNNVIYTLDIDSLERMEQISEYFYLYQSLDGKEHLYSYDKVSKVLVKYDSVSKVFQDANYPEYFHFNYLKDNQMYGALLRTNGQLVDSAPNVKYELKSNHIVRANSDNTISLLRLDGTNINEGTDLQDIRDSSIVYGNYFRIRKIDDANEIVYFDGISLKRFGSYNLESQLISNRFLRISKHCEGTNVVSEWDGDDFYSSGLVDLNGNIILDPEKCYGGYYINTEHQIIEPYYMNLSGIGRNSSAGIMDFSGNLIPELVGYSSENQLSVSDEGDLKVLRPMGLKRYFNFVNGDGVRVEGYEDAFLKNIYNLMNKKIRYDVDYANVSSITHNKFYTLAYYSDIKLESEISQDDLNFYSGDVFYNENNDRIRVRYSQVYINLQNEVVFDQSSYRNANFDGLNFIAEKYDEATLDWSSDLISEFGDVVLADYSRIWKDDELGWYIATNTKRIPNPYGDDWDFELNLTRVIDAKSMYVLPYNFEYVNTDDLKRDGYAAISVYADNMSIEELKFDSIRKYGVLLRDGTFLVNPIYDSIGEFTRTGNAIIQTLERTLECTYKNDEGEIITFTCNQYKQGLINNEKGLILDAVYNAIEATNPTRMSWNTPNFDINGHVRIVNYVNESEMYYRFVGLANIDGALFEGAAYQSAYYKNGAYYLKKFGENWKVVSGSNFADSIEVVVPPVVAGADVKAIELSGDYVIATQSVYDETFDKTYDYVGVLNRSDMSVFIDFDYSNIKFENGLFYLELYNTSLGTTQQAVMNEQKEFVVPFNNKYDSISEYVDGYAIGQSGTKEPEVTGANPVVNLLSTFFLDVNAADDDFVLEVIDEDGKVVGDLSEQYESATLLGTVDGVTKALVKKDGKYYMATLVEKPITLIPITGVDLNIKTKSLNVSEIYSLVGTISPSNTNEPARIEWSSLNTDVASVDSNGLVKALKAGTTTISYKVNGFEAVATIIVKSTITGNTPNQDTASTIVETIIQNNPSLDKNEQNAVVNDVEKLVDYLNGEQNINDKQLLQTIKNVFELNPNFVSQLNDDEAQVFDRILNRVFEDAFSIDVSENSIKSQIDGLLLAMDILPLLEGDRITIKLNISEAISKKDEPVLASYIVEKNYDDEFVYTLDIELIQVLNELETILSELNRPVTLTFALPDRFVGIGELKIIRIHNGIVTELPVTLNPNYTFSFETDQFSSFTLVKAKPVSVITGVEPDKQTTGGGMSWMGGMFALLLLVVGVVGALVYKRKAQTQ